nr:site-specific integrase [uncultured Albidiferax sp.]
MAMNKRYLTDGEQRLLLMAARGCSDALAQRDHAWMRLLIETGMRVNELATLSQAQAIRALASGWLVVTKAQRKGGKQGHEYLVTEPVRQCLERLLKLHADMRPTLAHGWDGEPPLLWGRCTEWGADGDTAQVAVEHLSVRSLQARMAHWTQVAGLPPGVSPHWLRHTRGVNIIRRSRGKNPLKVAQQALGHVSIASTGIYTQMCREEYEQELHNVAGGRMRKAAARGLAGQGSGVAA